MEYFVTIDGTREGPFSTLQLRQKLREGLLTPDCKVWRRGLEGWTPLREVDALVALVYELEEDRAAGRLTTGNGSEAEDQTGRFRGGDEYADDLALEAAAAEPARVGRDARHLSPREIGAPADAGSGPPPPTTPPPLPTDLTAGLPREARAVLRFLARMIDFAIVSMAIGVYVTLTVEDPMEWAKQPENARNLSLLLPVFAIGYEMILVALFGTTIGKLFFGIRLVDAAGGLLGPSQAAIRTCAVWAVGLGFGFSFLILILPLFWWFRFRSTGVVPWDSWSGLLAVHRPPGRVRLFFGMP